MFLIRFTIMPNKKSIFSYQLNYVEPLMYWYRKWMLMNENVGFALSKIMTFPKITQNFIKLSLYDS